VSQKTLLTIFAAALFIAVISCAALFAANQQEARGVIKTVSVQVGIWPSDTPTPSRTPTHTLTPTPTMTATIDPRIAGRACLFEITNWSNQMKPVLQAGVLLDEAYGAGNVDSALRYLNIAVTGIISITPPSCNVEFQSIHSGYSSFLSLYAERIKLDLEGDSAGAEAKYRTAITIIEDLNTRLGTALEDAKKNAGVP
jgi:hypothetical protein